MRLLLLLPALFALVASSFAAAAPQSTIVATAGVTLAIPPTWHVRISKTPACDPERLIIASSMPIEIRAGGQLAPPRANAVLVLLLEDRYSRDRPVGDLRRPTHFSIAWNRLAHVKPVCGLPNAPAYMRYFKTQDRYLGFIVYPGQRTSAATRARTVAVMDSLCVSRQGKTIC